MKNFSETMNEKKVLWRIRRFANPSMYAKGIPSSTSEFEGNVMLNEGINELWTLACSEDGTKWDGINAHLGVGDSSTAASASQTGLQAAENKAYMPMEPGYPTYGSSQKVTFKASFGSSDANFAWNEFTVANADDDTGVNLNRKVSSQGTKSEGEVWELTLEITLS